MLYFVLQRDDIPYKVKGIIIGALCYFIFPIDLIPDMLGYTDDGGALLLAVGQVSMYIDENVKNSAKQQMKQWFDISDAEYKIEQICSFLEGKSYLLSFIKVIKFSKCRFHTKNMC